MPSLCAKEINPQSDSPLFNRIPPEVRNSIFKYALTAYEDPTRRYERNAYYYRPGYTCAHKIDTNLLLTCRRVYAETARLPASINEQVSWYYRGPPNMHGKTIPLDDRPGSLLRRRELRRIHVFAQQFWLEESSVRVSGFARLTGLWNIARPTHLLITIRHTDWWMWEVDAPLALDPKRAGRPSPENRSRPSDRFDQKSWGAQFQNIRGLECLQLELETVESKATELDAIVSRAKGWRFPLRDGRVLVLDERKSKRTGWIGGCLGWWNRGEADDIDGYPEDVENCPPSAISTWTGHLQPDDQEADSDAAPRAPLTAKQRLEAAGVVFDDDGSVKGLPEDKTSTYYVVTLTWRAQRQ